MKTHRSIFVALSWLLLPLSSASALADGAGGIGVLGDSYSDEYQFYPPDRSRARNWVEILAATRGLDFGPFSETDRGAPRGAGYAYNWASSGATSDDMLAAGQHTGLASQVAAGQVRFVWIFVGGNDFLRALDTPDPDAEVRKVPDRAMANVREAVATILAAHPQVKVVVGTLPDVGNLPEVSGWVRSGRLPRERAAELSVALTRYNNQLRAFVASQPRMALIDMDFASRVGSLLGCRGIPIAGHSVARTRAGDDLESFFLADGRHPGLLAHGLVARAFVNTLNAKFGAGIPPLTDADLNRVADSLIPSSPPRGLLANISAPSKPQSPPSYGSAPAAK